MSRINEIWAKLESSPSHLAGLEKVRFSENSPCDLFLGLKTPENARLLSIRLSVKRGKETAPIRNIKGLRIEKALDSQKEGFFLLSLVLSETQYKDIFDVLISDIIPHIIDLKEEKEIIKRFYDRLYKWQALFEKYNPEGLSPEAQQGLFSELLLLKKLITYPTDKTLAVQSWVGSTLATQDFQMKDWAVEVKSTSGNNHQKIHINNERQLDERVLKSLFLFHVSLDIRQGNALSLITLIEELREMLRSESRVLDQFNYKLAEAGYFAAHKELYVETGYNIRSENFYQVKETFPRIREDAVPPGVGDIKYSIDLSGCEQYLISEAVVLNSIIPNG